MKKINILYTIWGTSFGGAEKFVLNVVKCLNKDKYNIVIFSDSDKIGPLKKEYEKAGAKVIISKYHRFKHPIKFIRQIKSVVADEGINIIHANDDYNMIFSLVVKSKAIRYVAHSHSTKFFFTKSKIATFFARIIIPAIIRNKADVLVGCSNEAGDKLFSRKKYMVIPNGIEMNNFIYSDKNRNCTRKKMKIKNDEKVILNIGRMDNAKNQTALIDIFANYHAMNDNSKLLIIGNGPERKNIENKVSKLGLTKSVSILEPQKDICDYYNAADVFVMTSKFEGLPMVLIEAQANGLPVVASTTISSESKINDNFEFINLDDDYNEWTNTIQKMKRQKPNKTIGQYSIETSSRRLEKIYES